MTCDTSGSCTYDVAKGSPSDGVYSVWVQASDGTNTSNSAELKNIVIDAFSDDSAGDGYLVDVAGTVAQRQKLQEVGIIIVLLIGGYYLFVHKGNKK